MATTNEKTITARTTPVSGQNARTTPVSGHNNTFSKPIVRCAAEEYPVNLKFYRKFLKLRKLCLRLQKNTPFWELTYENLNEIYEALPDVHGENCPSLPKNLNKVFETLPVAQGGTHPFVCQSLSERVDCMFKTEGKYFAQIGIPFSLEHTIGSSTKEFISDSAQNVVETISNISETSINTLRDLFDTFSGKMMNCIEGVKGMFGITTELLKFIALSMVFYYLLWKSYQLSGTSIKTLISIVIGFLSIMVDSVLLKNLISKFYSIYCKKDGYVAQAGDVSFLSMLIPPIFAEAVGANKCSVIANLWRSKDVDLVLRRLCYFGDIKMFSALENLSKWSSHLIEKTSNLIKIHLLGHDPAEFLDYSVDPLTDWYNDCEKHFGADIARVATYSDATLADIKRLYHSGIALLRHPLYKDQRSIIQSTTVQLLKYADKIKRKVGTDAAIRNPPITLYMYGDTGVGKSTLTYPLCATILKEIYTRENNTVMLDALKKNYKEMIYVRSSEQEFWDGYTQQLVTVFDDFNQRIDSTSNPSLELFEIIRASNIFPYPLHMATIDEKSNTTFQSRVIVCSTNNKIPQTESLNFPKALVRRFTKFIEVVRDPSYEGFNHDALKFKEYDPFSVDSPGEFIREWSFKEIVDNLVDTYFSTSKFVESVDRYIQEQVFGDILAQAGEVEEFYDCGSTPTPISEYSFKRFASYLKEHVVKTSDSLRQKFLEYSNKFELSSWQGINPKIKMALLIASLTAIGFSFYSLTHGQTRKQRLRTAHVKNRNDAESYTDVSVKNKVEAYTEVVPKNRVESYGETVPKIQIESYNDTVPKSRVESYSETIQKKNKVEAYTDSGLKIRVESYSTPDQPKLKVETGTQIAEACIDINASEQISKVISKNTYLITLMVNGQSQRVGHCTFLKGRVCVSPAHYLRFFQRGREADPDAYLQFDSPIGRKNFFSYLKDMSFSVYQTKNILIEDDFDSRDLMHFYVQKAMNHCDVSSFYANRRELQSVGSTRIQLPVFRYASGQLMVFVKSAQGVSALKTRDATYALEAGSNRIVTVRDAWEYHLETTHGDCGAPLFVRNTAIGPGKIIGIHTAGGISSGIASCFATPFYKEDVDIICNLYSNCAQGPNFEQQIRENLQEVDLPKNLDDCEFVCHGKISKELNMPSKSAINPSPLYGKICEPVTDKTWLYPKKLNGELFDPLEYRTMRMGKHSVPISVSKVRIAKEALINDIYQTYLKRRDLLQNRFPSSYSFDEACLGIPGEPYVNAVKRDTSCGYPFVQKGWTRAKIFGNEQEYSLSSGMCDELRKRVLECQNAARQGIILDHYFIDTLKDERKPKEKCHKTRMFANGPIDYLVWSKMYFNPIVAILSEMRNYDHISVGSNVYSQDWDNIARYLKSKSTCMIAGDFEGFDASEQVELLRAAGGVLISLSEKILDISPDEKLQMTAIMESLYNSFHINKKGIVLQWLKSLPSGHYLTAVINSLLVNLAMCISFMESLKSFTYSTASKFFSDCGIVAYGDDHVISVPERYIEYFNQQTLPELLSKLGMFYTLETKSDEEINFKFRKLEDITYLKRRFLYDKARQRYIAPLDLSVVLEMSMWTRTSKDVKSQVAFVANHALRELALHEEEIWNLWYPKISKGMETYLDAVALYHYHDETRDAALGMSDFL